MLILGTYSPVYAECNNLKFDAKKGNNTNSESIIKNANYYKDKDGNFIFKEEEKLSEERLQNGGVKSSYCKNIVSVIPLDSNAKNAIADDIILYSANDPGDGGGGSNPYGTGSNSRSLWDELSICQGFVTVYFSKYMYDNVIYYDLDKIEGGYTTRAGSGNDCGLGNYVIKQWVEYGQTGMSPSGPKWNQTDSYTISVSTRSWYLYTPGSWYSINDYIGSTVGCNYYIKLENTNNYREWTLHIQNLLWDPK